MLSAQKQRALQALLVSPTRKAAAAMTGVTEKTLRGYFKDPEFTAEYKTLFREVLEDATRQGQQLLSGNMQTWQQIRDDPDIAPAVRTQAARAIHEYTLRGVEMTDILSDLEGNDDVL